MMDKYTITESELDAGMNREAAKLDVSEADIRKQKAFDEMEVEAERLAPGHLLLVNRELRQRANSLQVRLSIVQRAYNHYTKNTGQHQKDTEYLCREIEIALKNYKREAIR
jgi:hypothetical protein